ncbi:MAG: hypothetical protein M3458_09050 [Acidobacteriota bacterium]|nr:hypothetical protein [Acidobacteriota bacterium]
MSDHLLDRHFTPQRQGRDSKIPGGRQHNQVEQRVLACLPRAGEPRGPLI